MRRQEKQRAASSGEEILERLLPRLRQAAERYGLYVGAVLVAVLVGLLVHQGYRNRLRREKAAMWQALWEMPPVPPAAEDEDSRRLLEQVVARCQEMLRRGWGTDATPWLLLKLANAQRALGRLEEAAASYRRLLEQYPNHEAGRLAAEGNAAVLEQKGDYEAAARAYEEMARPGGPQFWVDAGRSWELAGEREAAISAYRRAVKTPGSADSQAGKLAAWRLSELELGKPLLSSPPAAPAEAGAGESPEAGGSDMQPAGERAQRAGEDQGPGDAAGRQGGGASSPAGPP